MPNLVISRKKDEPMKIFSSFLNMYQNTCIYTSDQFLIFPFLDQFRKVIIRYKRNCYNINVRRQSACLVINQIMVDSFALLLNCTLVGRASDPVTGPT